MTRPLRIFLCCQQDLQPHPVPPYRFWAGYFRSALAEAGHACIEAPGCDWAAGLVPQSGESLDAWRESTWQRALDFVRREHAARPIDLFLAYLYPEQVEPAALAEIRAAGVPSVNFFCDNVRLFRRVPPAYRAFDLHWVPEAGARPMYRRAGLEFIAAPMPCWVPPAFRVAATGETLPPTFVGSGDEVRQRLLADAFARGLQLELRGRGWAEREPDPPRGEGMNLWRNQWDFAARHGPAALARKIWHRFRPPEPVTFDFLPHVRPSPEGEDYWRVLRESRVCVGINRYPSPRHPPGRPRCYSRLRDIEAPMAGACYLTEWAPGLDELYEPGREIEVYRDPAELAAQVAALSRDEPRRRRLRSAGQARALGEHTIARSVEKIARHLGIR